MTCTGYVTCEEPYFETATNIRKIMWYLVWLGATWFIWLYWAPWQIMAILGSSPNHDGDS